MQSINKEPDRKELRSFGFITGGLTPVFFGLLFPWLFEHEFSRWPWIVGVVLITLALVLPMSLKLFYRVWMTIGFCLGWVNTRIILSVMFYIIIFPTGVVMRLLGKDPLARSIIREQKSYRVISVVPDKKHMERPY